MPKIAQLHEKYAAEAILCEIRTKQGAVDLMNNRALADASGIPYQTLLRRLKHPDTFTIGEMKALVKVIHLSPFELLSFLGYSKKDMKTLSEPETLNNTGKY